MLSSWTELVYIKPKNAASLHQTERPTAENRVKPDVSHTRHPKDGGVAARKKWDFLHGNTSATSY